MRAEASVTIRNRLGIHVRPAQRLVEVAGKFGSGVSLAREGQGPVNAKSIIEILTLGAGPGVTLTVAAEGDDAEAAVNAIRALIDEGFGED